jgi:glycosyltransferase involved in cell wall biosynthesis
LNCKVSIIVPVYNAEKHLRLCIDSVINQTLQEIEIIIINDGSTDNSKEIILDYVKKDNRIIFIDSANEGVSSARNKGIEKASGQYIGFVDADDYLDSDIYQKLFYNAEKNNASLAICNAFVIAEEVEPKKRLQLKNESLLVSDKAGLVLDFLAFKYDNANWNKIYAASIIKENHLQFHKNLSIWEDLLFNLQFIAFVNKIVILNESLYYYRLHAASVIADSKLMISKQYNILYESYVSFCNKNSLQLEKKAFIEERAQTCISNVFVLLKLRTTLNQKFFPLSKRFGKELEGLNPAIYTETKSFKRVGLNFYWLLRYKFYTLFSFLYVSNYLIKNRI